MDVWSDLQTTLTPYLNVNVTAVAVAVLCGLISIWLYSFSRFPDLPGPSLFQSFPSGEVYPLLKDSRATLRVLVKLSEKYGEVFQTWLGPTRLVVSANPTDIAQILSATYDFVRPEGMVALFDLIIPGGLLTLPKEIHRASRRKLKDNFNFTMLENCHSYLTDAVAELCNDLEELVDQDGSSKQSSIVDIAEPLATTTFRIIISIAFGCEMSREKRTEFYAWMDQLIDEMLKELLGYPLRQALNVLGIRKGLFDARSYIYTVCNAFIKRRLEESPHEKESRPKDALDAILSMDQVDLRAVTSRTVEFAIAGSHTTSQAHLLVYL